MQMFRQMFRFGVGAPKRVLLLVATLATAMLALTPIAEANSRGATKTAGADGVSVSAAPGDNYDMKATIVDVTTDYIDVAMLIKSSTPADDFHVADQNLRLAYDGDVFKFFPEGPTSAFIVPKQGHLTGLITQSGLADSYYSVPTLNGSGPYQGNHYISFNLELVGGPGLKLSTTWYEVTRLRLYFKDSSLDEHLVSIRVQNDSTDFPPTSVAMKNQANGSLPQADGLYFYGIHQTVPARPICCAISTSDW